MRRSLPELQDVTVTGKLLKKQLVKLDKQTNRRTAAVTANEGNIKPNPAMAIYTFAWVRGSFDLILHASYKTRKHVAGGRK
jgi:hypothetical protein